MSSFTKPVIVTPLDDGRRWQLVSGFYYYLGTLGSYAPVIYVPAGFITDFASTPRFIWWLLPPWGTYGKAAIAHDYQYRTHETTRTILELPTCGTPVTRKEADNTFYEAMRVANTPKWKAKIIYWAVRLFGRRAWNKKFIKKG